MLENEHAIIGPCLLFFTEVNNLIVARFETVFAFNGARTIPENVTLS